MLMLFRGIAERQETTFLIVSHDPLVIDYVDAAYDLHDGNLIQRQKAHSELDQSPEIEIVEEQGVET
jgi:ABC-type lipoprotein export system ATPase subunit